MKSRSEIFTEVTRRNALRREHKLPPINVREEVEKTLYAEKLNHFSEGCRRYAKEIAEIRRGFREEERIARNSNSYGDCAGSRLALSVKVQPLINAFLASRGYPHPGPPSRTIVYGEAKEENEKGPH